MLRTTLQKLPFSAPYLVISGLSILLFWPTWLRLANEWLKWEQVLAHGLPTYLIFLGLLLIHPPGAAKNHEATLPVRGKASWPGGIFLVLTVALWALLELVRIDTLAYLMLPVGVLAVSWAMLGFRATLSFLPYVLLMSLSLPIWADMVPTLVLIATYVVSNAVRAMGITALIEGAYITVPYGTLFIADGCSGIRYFAISILLAMLTSILNDYRWKGWLAALTLAIGLALLVNWIRISALVVIAYQTDMQSSLMHDHEMFGWVIYAAFVIPTFLLAPVVRRDAVTKAIPARLLPSALVFLLAAFLLGPVGLALANLSGNDSTEWQLTSGELTPVNTDRLPVALSLPKHMTHSAWQTAGGGAWVSLAQSHKQTADDKLVPYLPPVFGADSWYLEGRHPNSQIRIYRNRSNGNRAAIHQVYWVGSYTTESYRNAKLLQIPAMLNREHRFALVTMIAPCGPRTCDSATDRLQALSQSDLLETTR